MSDTPPREKWIVSADWLAARLDDPNVVVLDASWTLKPEPGIGTPHEEFIDNRIPSARFFDIDDVADPDTDLPHMLPSPELFAEKVGALGISNDHTVIVYDTFAPFAAPRAWWMFRVMGHDDVAVLNGGLEAWELAGHPTERGEAARPAPQLFTPRLRPHLLAGIDDVKRALASGERQVLDARSPGRFAGEDEEPHPHVPPGHMPGAKNLHFELFLTPEGGYRDVAEIERIFAERGIDPAAPSIFSCGSGVTACLPLLAAARLGHENHPVYDGSWSEWATRDDTEIV
ncbi:MAG TPA: sulfurtransferase, partial [Thermopetrobacter sp.]|nr:sulfurtransferase [Thermopetrobacter sp.]